MNESGCRVDVERGADDYEDVGLCNDLCGCFNHWYGFLEEHDVRAYVVSVYEGLGGGVDVWLVELEYDGIVVGGSDFHEFAVEVDNV